METIQHHLSLTTGIVNDLEKAIEEAFKDEGKKAQQFIERVTKSEREADALRRRVMDEISKGELSPVDRADLMDLVKRVDMVADWSRESTRILNAIPVESLPSSIKEVAIEMVKSIKECTSSLKICVDKMMTKPEEALQAADAVEREEERIDDIHGKARKVLGKERLLNAGTAVLIGQLFEALEMIADSCEDACDQVRVIMVRK